MENTEPYQIIFLAFVCFLITLIIGAMVFHDWISNYIQYKKYYKVWKNLKMDDLQDLRTYYQQDGSDYLYGKIRAESKAINILMQEKLH